MDDSELVFKAYCIEYFRRRHGISSREALSIFKRYGVISYIDRHYDVLHQMSMERIIDDLDGFIAVRS